MVQWHQRLNPFQRSNIELGSKEGGLETKSSGASFLSLNHLGQAQWSLGSFDDYCQMAVAKNAIVYRCLRMICENAAQLKLILRQGGETLSEHPVLDLLACPANGQCRGDFFDQIYSHLLINGNAYVLAQTIEKKFKQLQVLRPDRVNIQTDQDGWVEAYEYECQSFKRRFILGDRASPLLHLKLANPGDDHYGLSPLTAARHAIEIHNAASHWNKALLDNAARPSGAIVYSAAHGHLSPDQLARLKDELEMSFQGAKNAGRPLLLEGGLDWKSMGLTPRDMDFIEAKHVAAREIALAFGVPPMMLAIPGDNRHANFQEAGRVFWRQTILPLAGRVLEGLSRWLSAHYEEDLTLQIDMDDVDALSNERKQRWDAISKAEFLTDDEKRVALGFAPRS